MTDRRPPWMRGHEPQLGLFGWLGVAPAPRFSAGRAVAPPGVPLPVDQDVTAEGTDYAEHVLPHVPPVLRSERVDQKFMDEYAGVIRAGLLAGRSDAEVCSSLGLAVPSWLFHLLRFANHIPIAPPAGSEVARLMAEVGSLKAEIADLKAGE